MSLVIDEPPRPGRFQTPQDQLQGMYRWLYDLYRKLRSELGDEVNGFLNITGAGTNTVKAAAGKLRRVVLNNSIGGTAILYDNTAAAGTIIATIALGAGFVGDIDYDCQFNNGLTVVTTGASTNITVIYE